MDRRHFFLNSAVALGSIVSAEGAGNLSKEDGGGRSEEAPAKIGRPVRAVSIGFKPALSLQQVADLVDHEGARGADVAICGLPADDLLAQEVRRDVESHEWCER